MSLKTGAITEVRHAEHRGLSIVRWQCKCVSAPVPDPAGEAGHEQRATSQHTKCVRSEVAVREAAQLINIQAATLVCSKIWWFWHKRPLWCRPTQSDHTTQLQDLSINTSTQVCVFDFTQKPTHDKGNMRFRHRFIGRRCSLKHSIDTACWITLTRFFLLIEGKKHSKLGAR